MSNLISGFSHSQSSSDGHQSAFQRISQRLSLNSMQVRILARLQDQPPKYETQHNYETRMQLDRESQNPDDTRPPQIVTTVSTNAIYVAPPAYGDERYSVYRPKTIRRICLYDYNCDNSFFPSIVERFASTLLTIGRC